MPSVLCVCVCVAALRTSIIICVDLNIVFIHVHRHYRQTPFVCVLHTAWKGGEGRIGKGRGREERRE